MSTKYKTVYLYLAAPESDDVSEDLDEGLDYDDDEDPMARMPSGLDPESQMLLPVKLVTKLRNEFDAPSDWVQLELPRPVVVGAEIYIGVVAYQDDNSKPIETCIALATSCRDSADEWLSEVEDSSSELSCQDKDDPVQVLSYGLHRLVLEQ